MVAERPDRKGWNKGIRLEMDGMDKKQEKNYSEQRSIVTEQSKRKSRKEKY